MAFQTEYRFRLPRGYVDPEGTLHRDGVMRLATAKDEIIPLQDYRVQSNRAYLVVILLARVIKKLGEVQLVDTEVIENLFSTDLAYLQEFYRRINEEGAPRVHAACPKCATEFDVDLVSGQIVAAPAADAAEGSEGRVGQGGIVSYPLDQLYQEVAYIAYHFHWPLDDILGMEHEERHIWLRQIATINREINEARKKG